MSFECIRLVALLLFHQHLRNAPPGPGPCVWKSSNRWNIDGFQGAPFLWGYRGCVQWHQARLKKAHLAPIGQLTGKYTRIIEYTKNGATPTVSKYIQLFGIGYCGNILHRRVFIAESTIYCNWWAKLLPSNYNSGIPSCSAQFLCSDEYD